MHHRIALPIRSTAVAVALLAIGCTESVGPDRGLPGAPMFEVTGSGIALDRQVSTMGSSGSTLIKGFNPVNPQNGDVVVATFFWVGSSNIITSVTDHLTDPSFTPVDNHYTLVRYVTAGGISMATYAATNVQGIPVANPSQDNVYAVRANLSQPVTEGGIWLSAWSGAGGVSTQVSANSDSATTTVPVSPGAVAVAAGDVVLGTVLVRPPVGYADPPGFTRVDANGAIASTSLKADAEYAPQNASGQINPEWLWAFDQAPGGGTWLATAVVLTPGSTPPPPPPTNQPPTANFTFSCTNLSCGFTSTSSDPDGQIVAHSWDFGDGQSSTAQSPSHAFGAAGTYSVTLTVMDDQGETGFATKNVTVTAPPPPPNQAPLVNAGPDETALTGLLYTLNATFVDPDNNGPWTYTINWGDGTTSSGTCSCGGGTMTITKSHTYFTILPKSFTVRVTVRDAAGAAGSDTKVVTVLLL